MPETRLIVSQQNDATVVDFRDIAVLDVMTVEAISKELYALVDQQKHSRIVLDLSAVRFLASQMLGTLVALHKKVRALGGRMVVCGLAENLFRVFEISRLDMALDFAPDVPTSLSQISQEAPAAAASPAAPAETAGGGWKSVVNRQIRIFFAGALIIVPLAITAWIVWSVGTWLDDLGRRALAYINVGIQPWRGIGAVILIGVIYLFGLLTHLWIFRGFFGLLERLVVRLPGAKTIYESVRDLMKLFGGESRRMGRVVQYHVPDTDMAFMGILTNENPLGLAGDDANRKVAVYMPLSYMLGGPTVLVSPDHIVEVDMSVEQCLKLCATAQVGSQTIAAPPAGAAAQGQPPQKAQTKG